MSNEFTGEMVLETGLVQELVKEDAAFCEVQTLLLDSKDAKVWAQEFMKLFGDRKDDIDEGLMIGWFANAMAVGERWEDSGSIDCNMYTSLENHVAGAISTRPPFANQYSPKALPIARVALEALDNWEPSE